VPGGDELTDIENTFAEVALSLFAPGSVQVTLEKIVGLAVVAVDGCEAAGVLGTGDDGALKTLAASNGLAASVHQMQIEAGTGPCLESARSASTVYVKDLIDDTRWPDFRVSAVDAGIRTVLAHALSTDSPGALNLYAGLPDAFGANARAQALLFATLARLALDTAKERALDAARTVNLTEALRTRELIGQAQGILIERERITSEQAFQVLRRASQHLNVKLREVAATLVETGQRPDVGNGAPPGD
jgi:hypothetical protein